MKVPLSWICDHTTLDLTPEALAEMLTLQGLEVETIENISAPFSGVVVGEVISCEPHPDADKLTVAQVSDGQETVQVVCGAPNCRVGLKTAFAKVGARLEAEDKPFKIKKSKIRGVESNGMLCAADELGLSEERSGGIIELGDDLPLGQDLAEGHSDTVLDIALTPNLGYCNSIRGVLREIVANTQKPFTLPQPKVVESGPSITDALTVEIEDSEKCPRYGCRVIRGVTIGASPQWLQRRLELCGMRPVNNVVDATNYVMLELGHPIHAFDLQKIGGSKIVIRCPHDGESLVTLDDQKHELTAETLLICDANEPIAIAGIMGGANSEVGESTTELALEVAYFDPSAIRRASKATGISSEASKRFERSVNPNGVIEVLNRAASLIVELAGGEIAPGTLDIGTQNFPDTPLTCRVSRTSKIIGVHFAVSEVEGIFKRLGFVNTFDGQDTFTVQVPAYRADISGEIDLIEEVARIYGYNNIDKSASHYRCSDLPHAPIHLLESEARRRLVTEGLQEFVTCDLVGPKTLEAVDPKALDNPSLIRVVNPTSIEQSILRHSMLPGLIQAVKHNVDRKNHNIAAFEVGRVHLKEEEGYKEQSLVGIVLTGMRQPRQWGTARQESDFFDIKGIVENFLSELGIESVDFVPSPLPTFHPGRQVNVLVEDIDVGALGEVHPDVLRRLDLSQRVYFAELNLHDLIRLRPDPAPLAELPQYPGSDRDWTFTLSDDTPMSRVLSSIDSNAPKILNKVNVLDIYRSEDLGQNKRNITLRFTYMDRRKTLQQQDVDTKHQALTERVLQELSESVKVGG